MSEIEKRLMSFQAKMRAAQIDLAAIGPTASMRYLAGYGAHPDERLCLLLISPEWVKAVVPALNAEDWMAHVDIPPITWADNEGPSAALEAALADLPAVRRLAIDGAMRADFLLPLAEVAEPQETITAAALIAPLRARKSAAELAILQRAAAMADRAMQAAIDACQPGVTEAEVAWAAETAFRQDGAEGVDFTSIASGPNGVFPHHNTSKRHLQKGEAITLDIGATLDGYKSDITRMVFLGEPPAEFLKVYQAVLEANTRARAAVRPGVPAQEIDRTARVTLEAAGYAEYFVHRTGHGLGLEVHEPPWIMAGNQELLAEGMVFSVEPGAYLPGQFGVRIEDIVAVMADGVHTLTGFDHELVVKP